MFTSDASDNATQEVLRFLFLSLSLGDAVEGHKEGVRHQVVICESYTLDMGLDHEGGLERGEGPA